MPTNPNILIIRKEACARGNLAMAMYNPGVERGTEGGRQTQVTPVLLIVIPITYRSKGEGMIRARVEYRVMVVRVGVIQGYGHG